MGGFGSGRQGGRPTAESSLRIDLAWMIRRGLAKPGFDLRGSLNWTRGGEPSGAISYRADMSDPEKSVLLLSYVRGEGHEREEVKQTIRLTSTLPNYGGRGWWMICPYRGNRVGKLYMPPGGDRFAGRKAWGLGYNIQRVEHRQRPFEALFKLQAKLGCDEGWGGYLRKPKGMWHRTFERHLERYEELDTQCSLEMMRTIGLLRGELA